MRTLIVVATLLAAYLLPTPAQAVTFRTLPPMMVLDHEEIQDFLRQGLLSRMLEAGLITEAQAEEMQDARMNSFALEGGYWGIMIIPSEAGSGAELPNQ